QREVLHVARADLDDVRHLRHVTQALRIHRFGADEKPRLLARLGEQFQAGAPEPLERVGRRARLPRAAAQDHGARLLDLARRLDDLPPRLDPARPLAAATGPWNRVPASRAGSEVSTGG